MSARWWWLSWEERSEDYRPLRDPPEESILAWWCSGYAGDESYSTLVALVEAPTEAAAKKAINADWPAERRIWRFYNEIPVGQRPGDRFPLRGWALERVRESERRAKKEGGR